MKRANLYIWLIALLTYPVISNAQSNDFSLYFYNSVKQRRFEQFTNYITSPHKNWTMQINGKNTEDNRLDFNQNTQNSILNISLLSQGKHLKHNLQSGYEFLLDYSSLESNLKPYRNRTGFLGYGIILSPVDSLSIEPSVKAFYRKEQDRFVAGNEFASKGLLGRFDSRYAMGSEIGYLQLSGSVEQKKMNWDAYQTATANVTTNYSKSDLSVSCLINASARTEDLYVLGSPDSIHTNSYYSKLDEQNKKSLFATINASIPMGSTLTCTAVESYSANVFRHEENLTRNTGDYNNLAQLNFMYVLTDNITLQSNNAHNYYIKDLSYISNTRIIDIRTADLITSWEYHQNDSLSVSYSAELRRTLYPDSEHKLDNDYLSNIYKIGWIFYYKDRIRIANRFLYLNKDEVFINSLLSANNNRKTGLQWQPELDILLGDSFLLQQNYLVRADYDNYKYDTNPAFDISDTFYRQLSAEYQIIYDSTPLAAKVSLPKWNLIAYRNRKDDAFRLELGYAWDRYETSDEKQGNVYIITGTDTRQMLSLSMQKQLGMMILQLKPKYSWGNWVKYNWKEYNLLFSTSLKLNRDSFAEFSLNPVGSEFDDLDWRFYSSLNLIF